MNHTTRTGLTTAALIAAAGAAVALTACSPSQPSARTRPVTTVTVTAAANAAPRAATRSVATRPAHVGTTAASPARTRSSASNGTARTTASTTAPPAEPVACPNGTVSVTATRGGALPGEEIALLRFTNTGSSACSLTGFPGVELLTSGSVLGRPAVRSKLPMHTLQLNPGTSVTARLHDDSRCNAHLSDEVGVYVPNQTTQLTTPLQLRACALTIDPVRG